jgi:hypothetical protein
MKTSGSARERSWLLIPQTRDKPYPLRIMKTKMLKWRMERVQDLKSGKILKNMGLSILTSNKMSKRINRNLLLLMGVRMLKEGSEEK